MSARQVLAAVLCQPLALAQQGASSPAVLCCVVLCCVNRGPWRDRILQPCCAVLCCAVLCYPRALAQQGAPALLCCALLCCAVLCQPQALAQQGAPPRCLQHSVQDCG